MKLVYVTRTTNLARVHNRNIDLLHRRARDTRAPDTCERHLQCEVAELYAGLWLPPVVAAVEWDAPKGYRGDLVFVDWNLETAVIVETKYIMPTCTPERQNARLQHVHVQARRYQRAWTVLHPALFRSVRAATYTNITGLRYVEK